MPNQYSKTTRAATGKKVNKPKAKITKAKAKLAPKAKAKAAGK